MWTDGSIRSSRVADRNDLGAEGRRGTTVPESDHFGRSISILQLTPRAQTHHLQGKRTQGHVETLGTGQLDTRAVAGETEETGVAQSG